MVQDEAPPGLLLNLCLCLGTSCSLAPRDFRLSWCREQRDSPGSSRQPWESSCAELGAFPWRSRCPWAAAAGWEAAPAGRAAHRALPAVFDLARC